MSDTYYVGLAASFHDPALAIVGPDGTVLFAEATERYLQDKRALNAVPDSLVRVPSLIREHCGPDPELVVAVSWSKRVLENLHQAVVGELPLVRMLSGPINRFIAISSDHQVWPYPDVVGLRDAMLGSLTLAGLNLRTHRDAPPVRAVRRYDHHLTHAATACLTSPFDEATCAVVDGYGEWTSTAMFRWEGGVIEPLTARRSPLTSRPASLGLFYAMLCGLCGFDALKGEEWKVMGLASYGRLDEELYGLLRPMVKVEGLGLGSGYRAREHRAVLTELQSRIRREGSSPLDAADLAFTGQVVFSEIMGELLCGLHDRHPSDNLVLGGGCALNSAYNGRILCDTPFRRLHVPSAPADDGNALGAALLAFREDNPGAPRTGDPGTPYTGTTPSEAVLAQLVQYSGLPNQRHLPEGEVAKATAEILAQGRIVGWMQGRAEFGPRALGNRSVLADPRAADMKDRLNARVKFREEFRPFAPSILHEHGPEYFEGYQESRYMERALPFRTEVRDRVPAVVHEDGTGRLQTVKREWAPLYHALISEFHALTGVPLLLNTSFNVMGKPIIHSVEDAVGVFMTSGLDALVVGDHVFTKDGTA